MPSTSASSALRRWVSISKVTADSFCTSKLGSGDSGWPPQLFSDEKGGASTFSKSGSAMVCVSPPLRDPFSLCCKRCTRLYTSTGEVLPSRRDQFAGRYVCWPIWPSWQLPTWGRPSPLKSTSATRPRTDGLSSAPRLLSRNAMQQLATTNAGDSETCLSPSSDHSFRQQQSLRRWHLLVGQGCRESTPQ